MTCLCRGKNVLLHLLIPHHNLVSSSSWLWVKKLEAKKWTRLDRRKQNKSWTKKCRKSKWQDTNWVWLALSCEASLFLPVADQETGESMTRYNFFIFMSASPRLYYTKSADQVGEHSLSLEVIRSHVHQTKKRSSCFFFFLGCHSLNNNRMYVAV